MRSSSGPRVRQLAPSAASIPSTLPSWTHEDTSVHARGRDRSPEERRTRHITAAAMRLHSLQVCASSHAARPGCFSAPPLSHTHSRREPGEGRRIRDGEMLIIRGEATDSSHSPPKRHPRHPAAAATQECYLPQPGSSGRSGRGRDSSPGNSPSRTASEPGQRNRVLVDSLNQPQGK